MSKGHVTHAERDGVHVLRYFGKVDYLSACAIQRFLDDLVDHGKVAGLVFDLTCAEALDSTNLGLLARVNERAQQVAKAESMIVSKNENINDVLRSMGFDRIFEIVSDDLPKPEHDEDIRTEIPSQDELRHTMLEAHRALMNLSETGRAQFQEVVACLEAG